MRRLPLLSLLLLLGCPETPEELPVLGDCPTLEDFFAVRVQSEILTPICSACHTPGGAAEDTRFVLDPEAGLTGNLPMLRTLAVSTEDGDSLLLLKPTDTHPDGHGGGRVLSPDTADYRVLLEFVGRVTGAVDDCGEGTIHGPGVVDCSDGQVPGPRLLRRLTHPEYGSTVRDLLGTTARPEEGFAADNEVAGFTNHARALVVPPLLVDQYREAAEALADEAVTTRLGSLLPCSPGAGEACAEEFIEAFGRRAFRRPLDEADVGRYLEVWQAAHDDPADGADPFTEGIRWTVAAMLQSPHFLYRSELGARDGDVFALSPWEIAAELSYLVVGTTPDDALLDAAADGTLIGPEGLAAQLERLLADPRATPSALRFFGVWLHTDRLAIVPKDADTYPDLTLDVRAAMAGQNERLIADALTSGAALDDLLLADHAFLTDGLAAYYGLDAGEDEADVDGYRRVDLTGTPYGGLLLDGAMLTTHALPTSSSPIHRGVIVRERLLCQDLPPPPANLDTSPPEVDPGLSTRERYAAHSEVPECAACHRLIDPIGFGFEHFDGAGVWRATDGPHDVDPSGVVEDLGGGADLRDVAFADMASLAQVLADAPEVERCYARQWMRYGTGLGEEDGLACSAEPVGAAVTDAGGRLDSVFAALLGTPHFTLRLGGDEELDGPAAGAEGIPPLGDDDDDDDDAGDDDDAAGGATGVLSVDDDWGTGYCATVVVTNDTGGDLTWEVTLTIDGAITTIWNAEYTDLGAGSHSFVGVAWNGVLGGGGTTEFGFCAQR